jgi:hypothetical protein
MKRVICQARSARVQSIYIVLLAMLTTIPVLALETTSPVYAGALTPISGSSGNGSKVSAFSQRVVLPMQYAGKLTGFLHASLTDSNAHWTNSQFGTNGLLSYVEFDNGWTVDVADTIGADGNLALAGSLDGIVTVGDSYRIRPHMTVAGLFGPNNESGLKPGLNPSQADAILLQIPQSQQTLTIFYFSNAVAKGWYRADFSPAANQVIYPEQGVLVRRTVPGDINLFTSGVIKSGATIVPVEPGFNIVGTLKSSSNLPLSALNLYTGDAGTGLASGFNLTDSDLLLTVQPDGSTRSFFYFKSSVYGGWLDAGFNPADNTLINAGSAFFIRRKASNGPFFWTIPAE